MIENAGLQCDDQTDFVDKAQRGELRLGEDGADPPPAGDPVLDLCIGDTAEAREYLKFQELRIIETQRLCGLAQSRRVSLAADPAHAGPDVDRGLVPFVKQLGVKDDLAIGNGDKIGRNIGAQVAGVGFSNRGAVSEPPPAALQSFAARSSRRACT